MRPIFDIIAGVEARTTMLLRAFAAIALAAASVIAMSAALRLHRTGLAPVPMVTGVPTTTSTLCDTGPNLARAGRGMVQQPNAFELLPPVTFHNRNSKQSIATRLYSRSGEVDVDAAKQLDILLADHRDPKQPKVLEIDRRLLQLLYRTAYHFRAPSIEVTSAFRMPGRKREGLHALGRAIDFGIPGLKVEVLASYLRTFSRVGVGIYTHSRTGFVHLDVRQQSYHWLDASPPGRTWRGLSIGNKALPARDAAYVPADDLPEDMPVPHDS